MRIIGGTHKGRTIKAPTSLPVRPTTDFAKEAIFNILNNHFEFDEINVLDLFCGTGNISYEFASREATSIMCVDSNYGCTSFIKKTVLNLKMEQIHVAKSDVFTFLNRHATKYNIVFADPPYDSDNIDQIAPLVFEKDLVKQNGWLIVEHGERTDLSKQIHFKEKRKYGNVNFSIFEKAEQ